MTRKLAALCLGLAVTAGAYKVGSQAEPVVPHLDIPQTPCQMTGNCSCGDSCPCTALKECLVRATVPAEPATPKEATPPDPAPVPVAPVPVAPVPVAPVAASGVSYTTAPAVQLEWLPWVNQHGQYIGHRWTHPSTPRMPYRQQPVQAAPPPRYQPQTYQSLGIFGRVRRYSSCGPGGCN